MWNSIALWDIILAAALWDTKVSTDALWDIN